VLELIQFCQDFRAVLRGIDAGVHLRNFAVGIDQEAVARGELGDSKICERSVGVRHFVVGVGEEFEVESFFGAELFVGVDGVEAHAQNYGVAVGVLRLVHLKLVGFAGSTWGLVFGVEVEHHPFAAVVLQTNGRSILRWQGELGSVAANGRRCSAGEQARDEEDQSYDCD
jgi:hypothetical protein